MIKIYLQKSINFLSKKLKQDYKKLVLGLIIITFILGIGSYRYGLPTNKQTAKKAVKMTSIHRTPIGYPTPTAQSDPENSDQLVNPPNPTLSPIVIASPTLTATPMPTSAPTRTPNPPMLTISYPSEMQFIEFTRPEQQLCIVDIPTGGDTSGLQKKHSINDGAWTSYVDIFVLCFKPKEGLNRFSLQYKNQSGEESVTYTRQFTFRRLQQITLTLSGEVFNDENCNNIKDNNEIGFANQIIDIMQSDGLVLATVTSDSSGNYFFSKTVNETESITIIPMPRDRGLVYTPPTVTLNNSNKSAVINISHCP